MNILTRIEIIEGSQVGALFFESVTGYGVKFDAKRGEFTPNKQRNKHCEMFRLDCLLSVGLNPESVIFRFNGAWKNEIRSIKIYIRSEDQIQDIADLVERTLEGGLNVIEHYANIQVSKKIKNVVE